MQSAARVPILVSFEVQDYEGPDSDPKHSNQDSGQNPLDEHQVIKSVKQQKKLKAI